MLIVKWYENKSSERLTNNVVRVRQLDRGIASAILFFVSIRLAAPPAEARIYELDYRRFGNCEKMYAIQK